MTGVLLAAAVLLGYAGGLKIARPAPTRRAVQRARLPLPRWHYGRPAVRALGAVEIMVALAVLVVGTPLAAVALGLLYAGFGAFALRLRARSADQSCGCMGDRSAPVGFGHLLVTAGFALAGLLAAALDPASVLAGLLAARWWAPVVAGSGLLLTYVAMLAMTELPRLTAAIRRVEVRA